LMDDPDEALQDYERQAKACRKLASESDPPERERLQKLAAMWENLAEERRRKPEHADNDNSDTEAKR
jgi:hypothetical protein